MGGDFILFHRPVSVIGGRPGAWLSRSTDLRGWADPEPVFGPRPGGWWDSAGVGIGPPPIETPEGWLMLYHGVRDTTAGALYRVGLLLLDLDNPTVVRTRAAEWVLGPTEPYERIGNVHGVVFSLRPDPTSPTPVRRGCTTAPRAPASRWPPPGSPPSSPTCWPVTPPTLRTSRDRRHTEKSPQKGPR
jgi:hypothetical protein